MVRSFGSETHDAHRNAFGRPTVLVVGDVIYDLYLAGTVRNAATAPVFSDASRLESLGGAANAAANLEALGNDVRLLGIVGADASGRRTREMLRERGIADTFVLEDMSRPTTQRTYLVAEGRQVLRLDHESRTPLSTLLVARLLECADALLPQVDAVVCADSGKGVCAPELIDPLLAAARSADRPVFVDCSSQDPERYHEVTALVVRHDVPDPDPPGLEAGQRDAVRALIEQSRAQAVLLTCGQDGLSLFHPPERPLHLAVRAGGAGDGDGSGRAAIAALCTGVLNGLSMAEAARLAAEAAGIAANKGRTAVVSWHELLDAVGERSLFSEGWSARQPKLATVL